MVGDVLEADAGAIAEGFPAWTGGPLSFIEVEGLEAFIAQAEAFAEQYGERFAVPANLRERLAGSSDIYA
ncbi:multifunctional fatty acid oxidation complex subunit alpha [compost metagenome]